MRLQPLIAAGGGSGTAKGAGLGTEADRLIVEFNFAYQPLCAYDERWSCPLAPEANALPVEIAAGEKLPSLRP